MNPKLRRSLINFYFFTTGFGLALLLSGTLLIANSRASEVPTTTVNGALIPDFDKITFDSMPPIQSNGSFLLGSASRSWSAGQKPASFMSLGDFPSMELHSFDLETLGRMSGINPTELSLEKFVPLKSQTLESLVKAIPSLAALPVSQVLPVKDLISQSAGSFDEDQTIGELLHKSPQMSNLSFANLDLNKYKIADVPSLSITQMGAFDNWQGFKLQDVPGLTNIPLSNLNVQPDGTTVGKVDVVFGAAESSLSKSVSGSNVSGFGVPCDQGCAHIEVSGAGVLGRQWVSGKYQLVRGGEGVLGQVNGGKEPTGRLPFGDAFKVVLTDVDEKTGSGTLAMFMRFCKHGVPDLGCTPYFLGPMSLMQLKENQAIFLGQVGSDKGNSPSTPTQVALDEVQKAQNQLNRNNSQSRFSTTEPATSSNPLNDGSTNNYTAQQQSLNRGGTNFVCTAGVNDDALSTVLSSSSVANLISTASSQIDPTTGRQFTGERLIERIAQIQFGGSASVVDSTATNAAGLSAKDYGKSILDSYKQALHKVGC